MLCKNCKAPILEGFLTCEYCGTEVVIDDVDRRNQEGTIRDYYNKSVNLIAKLKKYASSDYKLKGYEEVTLIQADKLIRTLETFSSDDKKVKDIIAEMIDYRDRISIKVNKLNAASKSKRIFLSFLYFIGVEILILAVIYGVSLFSPEAVDTAVSGFFGVLGLIIGAMIGALWGAIGGGIVGILIGMVVKYALISLAGNIILFIIWNTIFIIVFAKVVRDKL